ncbi:DUF4817 domain-containing protein [Trichonephila clavipes]|nr:DUF4817 domain-containing protein [Trichonephila clavipes]
MDVDRTTTNVFNAQPIGTRRRGRPKLRWIDGLENDLIVLRTKNWRTLAGRRLAWKRLQKAKFHPEMASLSEEGYIVMLPFCSSWNYSSLIDGDRFNSCQVIYSQFGLAIHQNDHQATRRFVEWAQNEIGVVPDFHRRILFSDEVHFWLNGYVNKQNCLIWSEANPQVVTINGDRYRDRITNFFIPELNNHDVQELWFQQDGATCHTARAKIYLLKDTFGDRLISRFGPVNWPPRSCDLTPLDYFLWGYVKSLVYADKSQTLDHLEDNIRRVIADIRPQMLEKVIENWMSRLDYIRASHGNRMPEIIFKM